MTYIVILMSFKTISCINYAFTEDLRTNYCVSLG